MVHFNTSHVNVNLLDLGGFIDLNTNFNTCNTELSGKISIDISIHLMLMLIEIGCSREGSRERFQYISC